MKIVVELLDVFVLENLGGCLTFSSLHLPADASVIRRSEKDADGLFSDKGKHLLSSYRTCQPSPLIATQ